MRHRRIAIIDQFNRPATLVFNPHKDDARTVAGGQLLIRLIPLDQYYLEEREGGLDHVQHSTSASTYVRAMTPQIVVGAQRIVHVLAAMRCGECDAHNAAYIARGQPSLLIVVGAIQLPALILQSKKKPQKTD